MGKKAPPVRSSSRRREPRVRLSEKKHCILPSRPSAHGYHSQTEAHFLSHEYFWYFCCCRCDSYSYYSCSSYCLLLLTAAYCCCCCWYYYYYYYYYHCDDEYEYYSTVLINDTTTQLRLRLQLRLWLLLPLLLALRVLLLQRSASCPCIRRCRAPANPVFRVCAQNACASATIQVLLLLLARVSACGHV